MVLLNKRNHSDRPIDYYADYNKTHRIMPDIECSEYTTITHNTFSYCSCGIVLPRQGWKIHVSATISNYQNILDAVARVCFENKLSFKYVNNKSDLELLVSKHCSPLSIGKLITIYPSNESEFLIIIKKIHLSTKFFEGVTVLTDKKHRSSNVVHYRYGVISADSTNNSTRPKLISPDGIEYEDISGAYYSIPNFVTDPFGEEDKGNNHDIEIILVGRYKMCHIIKISAGGNVYYAIDLVTERPVIIKEARNHVMATVDHSVIDLLKNETSILKKTAMLNLTPTFIDEFILEGSYFLVQELVEGKSLKEYSAKLNLLNNENSDEKQAFNIMISTLIYNLKEYIEKCHHFELIIDDISPENIILDDNFNIKFIDFDSSYFENEVICFIQTSNSDLGIIPSELTNKERDNYKVGLMLMGLLTGVNKQTKFDTSCKMSIETFIALANLNDLDESIVTELLHLVYPNKHLYSTNIKLTLDERQKFTNLDKLRESILKTIVLNRKKINIDLDSKNLFSSWETSKCLILYKIFDDEAEKHNEQMRQIQILNYKYITSKISNYEKSKFLKIDIDLNYHNYHENKKQIFQYLDTLKDEAIQSDDASLVMNYLSLVNDLLEKNENAVYLNEEFKRTVQVTLEKKVLKYKDKTYIKHYSFGSPYISTGNAGFIQELLRNMRILKSDDYVDIVHMLAEGINHKFAKSLGIKHGLAGLAMSNLDIYQYTRDVKFLSRSIDICTTISLYSFTEYGCVVIPSSNFESISYEYHDGLLGYYHLLNKLITIGENHEKIH